MINLAQFETTIWDNTTHSRMEQNFENDEFGLKAANEKNAEDGHLRTHLKMHCGEKSNKCSQCDFASSNTHQLRTHLITNIGEKSHKCSQCDYASSSTSNLSSHLKTHSGEKSNKCNQCGFASARADKLTRHLKTHSEEKQMQSK